MAVIYSNDLKSQASVEADGGVVEFNGGIGDTNLFNAVNGYSPGEGGRLEMTAVLSGAEKTSLESEGTLTIQVSKSAIAVNDSQSGVFSQSFGQVMTGNGFLFAMRAGGSAANGRLQFGHHSNGSMAIFRGDGTNSDLNAATATTTAGKSDYVEFKVTWTNGGATLDIWIDGVNFVTRSSTMDFTAISTGTLFDDFWVGGDQNRGLEDAAGNNIFLKDLVVEDSYYNPAIDLEIAVVGDSFAVAGKSAGIEFYDSGYLWEIQRFYMQNRGLRAEVTPFATSGEGYSPTLDPVNNLSGEVTAAVAANPDVIILQGSVNDLQDDGNGTNLVADYQSSMEGYVDQAIANSSISEIYVTSILPWLRGGIDGSAAGNWTFREDKTDQADVILAGLNDRGRTKFLNAISDLGGTTTYSLEYTIGTATGTDDTSDFHLSGEGHPATGFSIGSLIDNALNVTGITGPLTGSLTSSLTSNLTG